MTRQEIKRAEQIREEVRKVINQMLDEEYENVLKDIENGKGTLTTRSLTEIIDNLLSPSSDNIIGKPASDDGAQKSPND